MRVRKIRGGGNNANKYGRRTPIFRQKNTVCLAEQHLHLRRRGHSQTQNNSKRGTMRKTVSSSVCVLNHNRLYLTEWRYALSHSELQVCLYQFIGLLPNIIFY